MRLAHISDVHFYAFPGLRGSFGKRALGLANLYVGGRRGEFGGDTIPSLVEDILAQKPDALAITGDLTAMATEEEFAMAKEAFAPLLNALPVCMIPGNHDVYTHASAREHTMEKTFASWMAGGEWNVQGHSWGEGAKEGEVLWPAWFRFRDVNLVAVNPCRPTLASSGRFGPGDMERLERMLEKVRLRGGFTFLLCHYPLLEADGTPYVRRGRNLLDLDSLLEVLKRQPVGAVLHGHEHHWYTTALRVPGGMVPILNCGSSGYARKDPDKTAGYFLHEVEGGKLMGVRRRILQPEGFIDHPGGDARPPLPGAGVIAVSP